MTPFGGEWVSTVEAHRSGIPHINYMIRSADLAAWLRREYASRRPACETDVNAMLIRGELKTHLLACGFGRDRPSHREHALEEPINCPHRTECCRLAWVLH